MVTGKTDTTHISRFEQDYHSGLASRCKLHLFLSDKILFSTVFDPVTHKIRGIEEFPISGSENPSKLAESVRQGLEQSQAGTEFDSVQLALNSRHCTLVPDAVFEPDRCRDYLSLNFGEDFSGICLSELVHQSDIHSVFHYPTELVTLFQNLYHTISFSHASCVFIESALRDFKGQANPTLIVHPSGEYLSITAIQDSQLKLFNYYDYRSPEDLAYYVMFTIEQLELKADEVAVKLVGEISLHDSSYSILNTYLGNLDFYQTWNREELPEFAADLDLHRYYGAFNQVRCG